MKVGNKIKVKNAAWTFNNNVPKTFSKHIKNSVPFYIEGHDICIQLSDFFLKEKSVCYDLGCSTGTLINKISLGRRTSKISLVTPFASMLQKHCIFEGRLKNSLSM